MNNSETIKGVLLSVLDSGVRSPLFNQFYQICINYSVATLRLRKNLFISKEIIEKLGYSIQDMARDCIDDLFETKDGIFIHLTKYFNNKIPGGILNVHPDILETHLAVLIKSRTNQQLSELRENLGEIYFRIKKSLSTDLSRKRDLYKRFVVKDIQYIQLNNNSAINLELPQVDKTYLISELLKKQFKNYNVSQILPGVFEILYSQQEFCKAIKEKHLLSILREYYTLNMRAAIENNVEYIEYEDENESFYPFEGMEKYERN